MQTKNLTLASLLLMPLTGCLTLQTPPPVTVNRACPAWVKSDLICPPLETKPFFTAPAMAPVVGGIRTLQDDISDNCYQGAVVCKDGKRVVK